jgi:hypothetical protein
LPFNEYCDAIIEQLQFQTRSLSQLDIAATVEHYYYFTSLHSYQREVGYPKVIVINAFVR